VIGWSSGIDLGRTGTALAGLAIPAASQVVRVPGLDLVERIEDDHAFANLGRVIDEFAGFFIAAPDFERNLFHGRRLELAGRFISSPQ
jgi:hypothetical protein